MVFGRCSAVDKVQQHDVATYRNNGHSSQSCERDVLWTDAGFSAAFWGSDLEWYSCSSKSAPRLWRSARARLRVVTRAPKRRFCSISRQNLRISRPTAAGAYKAASNYAASLRRLERFEEAKSLLRKTIPLVQRVRGESHDLTLRMRWNYAEVLYLDTGATLDTLREAVMTLEDTARTLRRVFGSSHPITTANQNSLQNARAALRARETPPPSSPVTSV